MPSLALTGNIGSGKTEALDLLVSLLAESGTPVLRFSADEENRRLLGNDPEVAQLIRSQLGAEYCTLEGSPDREKIGSRNDHAPAPGKHLETHGRNPPFPFMHVICCGNPSPLRKRTRPIF